MKITEKMLEDWICEHLEEPFWPGAKLIGRQIPLPHGILDLLVFADRTLVVELKARPIKEKDIGQVLRYVYDVKRELQRYIMDIDLFDGKEHLTFSEQVYSDLWMTLHGFEMGIESAVLPVLIGPSIGESVMAAASAAEMFVLIWSYNQEDDFFEFDLAERPPLPGCNYPFDAWVTELGAEIDAICESDSQVVLSGKIAELFGAKRWQTGAPRTLPFVTGVVQ